MVLKLKCRAAEILDNKNYKVDDMVIKVIKSNVFREVNASNYKNLIDKALYCYTWMSDR